MKISIVDDSCEWRKIIFETVKKYCNKTDSIDLYQSGEEFIKAQKKYEIVLMDIEMDGIDGLKSAEEYKKIYPDSYIIIITTHMELSTRGYIVGACRFMNKAKIEEEFKEAINYIREKYNQKNVFLIADKDGTLYKISDKEILYIETNRKSISIHTLNSVYESNEKMADLEEILVDYGFFRSHKSFLVNIKYITKIDKNFAYFENKEKAYISTRKYTCIKKAFIEMKKKSL